MSTEKTEEIKIDAPPAPATSNDNLKDLIEKNIKWSQVIYAQNKKINRKLLMLLLGGYLKWALILIPLILGIIYLPPIIMDMLNKYQGLFGSVSGAGGSNAVPAQLNDILSQVSGSDVQKLLQLIGKK